jgi:putative MFS transporter
MTNRESAASNPSTASASARLDRLPTFSFHRQMAFLLGFIFFFELGDINTFAFAAPAIRMQWQLPLSTIAIVTSATFFGMFIGATCGGALADRIGRKRALVLTTAWYSLFSLANALVWNVPGLFLTRLLTGVGLSAMTAVAITYIAEMFPQASRGRYQAFILMIGLLGIPAAAFVARFTVPMADWGWRLVFVWGALGIVFPVFSGLVEESPRWFEHRGRHAEADAVLTRIEARAMREKGPLPAPTQRVSEPSQDRDFAHLFTPANRNRSILFACIWMSQTLGYYGFLSWVPTLLVAHGFSIVKSLAWSSAMQLGGVPGALIAMLISDRFQRKWTIVVTALIIAACGLAYGLTFDAFYIMLFGFGVAMFIQTFAPMLYAYTAESFPTGIRSSGTGFTYGIGRLANVLGPLVIAFLFARYGYQSVFVYIAACWTLVAVIVGVFGPRTMGKAL